jgi:hypothetical protein
MLLALIAKEAATWWNESTPAARADPNGRLPEAFA